MRSDIDACVHVWYTSCCRFRPSYNISRLCTASGARMYGLRAYVRTMHNCMIDTPRLDGCGSGLSNFPVFRLRTHFQVFALYCRRV